MDVQSLHCPDCGAALDAGQGSCAYCGARLTVPDAAPGGPTAGAPRPPLSAFPRHPGPADRPSAGPCPGCRVPLAPGTSEGLDYDACPRCGGLWLPHRSLDGLCRIQVQAGESGDPAPPLPPTPPAPVAYHPCPACRTMMNRSAFGLLPGLILDACKAHGTWFRPGQIERLLAFLRTPEGRDAWQARHARERQAQDRLRQQQVLQEAWEAPEIHALGRASEDGKGLGHALKDLCGGLASETEAQTEAWLRPLKDRLRGHRPS